MAYGWQTTIDGVESLVLTHFDTELDGTPRKSFQAGEALIWELPYVLTIDDDPKLACAVCCAESPKKRCELCNITRYCTEDCRAADEQVHRHECAIVRDNPPGKLTDEERLVVRAITRWSDEQSGKAPPCYGNYFGLKRRFSDLVCHLEGMSQEEMLSHQHAVDRLYEAVRTVMPDQTKDSVSRILAVIRTNCHGVVLSTRVDQVMAGRAIYLGVSAMNHSCVVQKYTPIFEGAKYLIRAVLDVTIENPSDLTISYIPTSISWEERQRKLRAMYHFTCVCECCIFQHANPELFPSAPSEIDEVIDQICYVQLPVDTVCERLEVVLRQYCIDLPAYNYHVQWICNRLQAMFFVQQKFEKSLVYGMIALNGADSHATRVLTMYHLSGAMFALGYSHRGHKKYKMFLEMNSSAEILATLLYGRTHCMVRELLTQRTGSKFRLERKLDEIRAWAKEDTMAELP